MHFSSLCYFTFQQKSLKIGLCDKFFYFTCFAPEPGTCAMDMSMSWCARTQPWEVRAPPLEQGILVRKDLGQEVQGCVCSSCFVEEEILILLCQQKTVNDFSLSFRCSSLDCWTHICTTIHRIMSACNIHWAAHKAVWESKPFEEAAWGSFWHGV